MELEERRVLAVTAIDAAADIANVNEGQLLSNITVAKFTDADPLNTQIATIDWGDGTTTAGAIQSLGGDQYAITGSHSYVDNGDYQVLVTVQGQSPGEVALSDSLNIAVDNVAPTLTVPGDNLYVLNEGAQITIGNLGVFSDQGTSDILGVTVDWGDGTVDTESPAQNLFSNNLLLSQANGSGKVSGTHVYGDNGALDADGNYVRTIKVTVFDNDGGSVTKQFDVIVNNVAPSLTVPADKTIIINEGELLALSNLGVYSDPGFQDTHTATVDWGDGTVEAATVVGENGSGKIFGSHVYGDNGVLDANGDYVRTVKVTITDDDGASTTKEFIIIVNNVAPSLTVPADKTIIINEGELLALSNLGVYSDPGFQDTHTATVDWGDGTVEAATVVGENGSGKIFGSHVYGDNGVLDANGDYVRTVKVTITDDDGASTTKEFIIIVNNVAPSLTVPADKTIIINEGELLALSNLGVYSDPGFQDTHTATVDWGDGTVEAATVVGENGSGKIFGSHVYGDNGVLDANGDYVRTVKVTITDDDGASTTKEFIIIVNNVAPSLTVPADKTIIINEGELLALSNLGVYSDPGFQDTHTATVDWGDGTVEAATVVGENGSGKIFGSHVYGDNGVLDANGDYVRTVKVTITDDDGASTTKEFIIIVNNVAPSLEVVGSQSITQGVSLVLPLLGNFTDPGFLDTHTATIQWGDGTPTESLAVMQGAGFGSLAGNHIFASPGVYTATVTLIDDDGGVAVQSFTITVLASFTPTPILPPNPFGDSPALPPGVTGFTGGGRPDTSLAALFQANDVRNDLSSGGGRVDEASGVETNAAIEKRFILVIVYADGTESEPVTLPDADVSNLPGLWRRLPDNFYRVYQVQENGTLRLVTQGYVQGGQLVDPNDKNETQDQPPTSQLDPSHRDATRLALPAREFPSSFDAASTVATEADNWKPALASIAAREGTETNETVAIETPWQSDFGSNPAVEIDGAPRDDSASFLAAPLAAGVALVAGSPSERRAAIERALERLPASWSRAQTLWRGRKPR